MTKIRLMLPDGGFEDKMMGEEPAEYWIPYSYEQWRYLNSGHGNRIVFTKDIFLSEVAGIPVFTPVFTEDRK